MFVKLDYRHLLQSEIKFHYSISFSVVILLFMEIKRNLFCLFLLSEPLHLAKLGIIFHVNYGSGVNNSFVGHRYGIRIGSPILLHC